MQWWDWIKQSHGNDEPQEGKISFTVSCDLSLLVKGINILYSVREHVL